MQNFIRWQGWAGVVAIVFTLAGFPASEARADLLAVTPEELQVRRGWALEHLLSNLSEPGAAPGAVVASPSRVDPNYFMHWIRDAGLVVLSLTAELDDPRWSPALRARAERKIRAWIDFEARLQETPNRSGGLGEPRFHADGRADETEWGRPQNDGPALRALAAIRFAWREVAAGRVGYVRDRLYRAELPARTLVKKDLEYVAHHWRNPSFDIWEEVKGDHFFTRAVQRRALVEGAGLARAMGDEAAAQFYSAQALEIERALLGQLDRKRGIFLPTVNQVDGWTHKTSGLDVAVLLGVLHGEVTEGSEALALSSSAVRRSCELLEREFMRIYPINQGSQPLSSSSGRAPAIGRYPEDVYDGIGFSVGHPWFLATHAFAEWQCRVGRRDVGVRYLDRSLRHQGRYGEMAEQYQRHDGFQRGARDLTWSYASFLSAARACLE